MPYKILREKKTIGKILIHQISANLCLLFDFRLDFRLQMYLETIMLNDHPEVRVMPVLFTSDYIYSR